MGWKSDREDFASYCKFKVILYITYNDLPSGIFSSQVIDVVAFIRKDLGADIRLVSFISVRNFFKNRIRIKKEDNKAIVLPMFPGVHRWKKNIFLLKAIVGIKKPRVIIGRSVLATQLAMFAKSGNKGIKLIYDGRGAIAAEWKEYNVVSSVVLRNEIDQLEGECVQASDFRIAVSNKLVKHWKDTLNYNSNNHVIIPCTLNAIYQNVKITDLAIRAMRKKVGFSDEDIVLVYSGSAAGWQSFGLMHTFLKNIFSKNHLIKLLLLSDKNEDIVLLEQEFPNRIICTKLPPNNVPEYLMLSDYGLLIREESVTNRVASPVKFAEYLACGLKVIISENLGDFSEFVIKYQCGQLFNSNENILKPTITEKMKTRNLALDYFNKSKYYKAYKTIIDN